MRILVTGADGFLGSHLAHALERAGHEVARAVFARAPGSGEQRVDLALEAELARLPPAVDAVVHAAGNVDPRVSRATMFAANVLATRNLVAWARVRRVRHFVHCSSVAVYGPLALGEERGEATPRLGLQLGLPYMRTKALAERAVETGGVPYTLLRPPVVLGQGDTVISRGFHDALTRGALPLVAGSSPHRRVSLALVDGLTDTVRRLLDHGPLDGALHAVDVDLTFGELASQFARVLGVPCNFAHVSWQTAVRSRDRVGFAWLVASARFGQHYRRERLLSVLGQGPDLSLESSIRSGLSGLQGGTERLF